jgi:hypothetical protein
MVEGFAAETSGASIPFVQSLPAVIGGLALIYVAYRTSRAEHRRWLRQERLKAYCTFLEIAAGGLEAIQAQLVAFYHGKGNPEAITRRAEQANDDLQRPVSSIRLLGPERVTVAAGAVRLSLSWSALAIIEAVGELDDDGKLPDKSPGEEPPVEELSRRVHSASEALNHFDRMAANEVQDRRPRRLTGNRGRGRPDGGEDQDY